MMGGKCGLEHLAPFILIGRRTNGRHFYSQAMAHTCLSFKQDGTFVPSLTRSAKEKENLVSRAGLIHAAEKAESKNPAENAGGISAVLKTPIGMLRLAPSKSIIAHAHQASALTFNGEIRPKLKKSNNPKIVEYRLREAKPRG